MDQAEEVEDGQNDGLMDYVNQKRMAAGLVDERFREPDRYQALLGGINGFPLGCARQEDSD